jgi:hypothetical protein
MTTISLLGYDIPSRNTILSRSVVGRARVLRLQQRRPGRQRRTGYEFKVALTVSSSTRQSTQSGKLPRRANSVARPRESPFQLPVPGVTIARPSGHGNRSHAPRGCFCYMDAVHSQYRERCLLHLHELRPDGTHRDLIGHERLSDTHEQADLEESRVVVNAKAVVVELKLVLFLPLAMGGRQQFSCRCSRRSMVHWNPPHRKTEIETSKRLQTPRRSIE